jgi:uncharacterized protein YukE
MSGINASPRVVLDLAKSIEESSKIIYGLTADLKNKLKVLGHTFQDEGFIRIQNYINATERQVYDMLPEFSKVERGLAEYAAFLIASGQKV